MSTKTQVSELSDTVSSPTAHPVKEFFAQGGLDVTGFPHVSFLMETTEKQFRAHRVYLPLRIPGQTGLVYESYCRVTRTLEIPGTSSGHRRFLQLEIVVEETPIREEDYHETLSFLASEVLCAHCREVFMPDPEVIDNSSVKVTCPDCLSHWVVKIETAPKLFRPTTLLLDLYHDNPTRLSTKYAQWETQPIQADDQEFYSLFSYHFESIETAGSLEYLFGDTKGYSSLSNGTKRDFESLCKGFINSITMEYFRKTKLFNPTTQLDQTEIQRKSEVTTKTSLMEQMKEAQSAFEPTTKVEITNFKWPIPREELPKDLIEKSFSFKDVIYKTGFALAGAAALGFIVAVVFDNIPRPSKLNDQSVSKIETIKIEAPKEEVITPSEIPENSAAEETEVTTEEKVAPVEAPALKIVNEPKKPEATKVTKASPKIPAKSPETKTASIAKVAKPIPTISAEDLKKRAEAERLKAEQIESSFRQGMLHLKLQQTKQAAVEFLHVLELDSSNAQAYRGLGLAYVYDQKFDEAITALEKYLKIAKETFDRDSVQELIQSLKERSSASVAKNQN